MKLIVNNVSKAYGLYQVLENVNLTFESNKIYGIFGKNGSGKTTLLEIMNGSDYSYEGNIKINDQFILNKIGLYRNVYLVGPSLFSSLMYYNIKYVLKYYKNNFDLFEFETAKALISKFGLNERQKIYQLSLGQKSLFLAAIAFSLKCAFVLLDEPLEGLDAMNRELFYEQLQQTQQKRKNTFIITSHIVNELEYILQEIIILKDKKIVLQEEIDAVKQQVFKIYGQKSKVNAELKNVELIYQKENNFIVEVIVKGNISNKNKELVYESLSIQDIFVAYHKGCQ